jgi:hypothetical protein
MKMDAQVVHIHHGLRIRGPLLPPNETFVAVHWPADGAVEVTTWCAGGGGGIRTRGPLARTPVFKTGAFDRSATPPRRMDSRLHPLSRRGGRVAEGTRLLSE